MEPRTGKGKEDFEETKQPSNASEAFASILLSVGGFGKWQWMTTLLLSCGLFTSMHNYGAIFLAATPDYYCATPFLETNISQYDEIKNFTFPWVTDKDGRLSLSKCEYYDLKDTNSSINTNFEESYQMKQCQSWHYNKDIYEVTLVSEYNLVCKNRWKVPTIQATLMLGILIGSVVAGSLSDRFGRRPPALFCLFIFIVSSLICVYSVSFEMFIIARFFIAASGQGLYLVNYTNITEMVEKKGKSWMPCFFMLLFQMGSAVLPMLAYFFRSWRTLQLVISIPQLFLLVYIWLLPESPRWLFINERFEEGEVILEKMAKVNGGCLPSKEKLEFYKEIIQREIIQKKEKQIKRNSWSYFFNNLKTLVRTKNMRRRSLVVFYGWFAASSASYGLAFSSHNINVSSYLFTLCMAAMAILATSLSPLILLRTGRRLFFIISMFLVGISSLLVLVVPLDYPSINFALTVIGRTGAAVAFNVVLIITAELVPTAIRNECLGIASFWARIGSILSSYIVDLLGEWNYALPSAVFGVMAMLSAFLSYLLPETGFNSLPESIEEIEAMPR